MTYWLHMMVVETLLDILPLISTDRLHRKGNVEIYDYMIQHESADVSGLGNDVKIVPEQRYYQQRGDGFLVVGELLGYIASIQCRPAPHK